MRRLFGRALAIREVDAGSCNGCELEISGLTSPVYDCERFGLHFVASPRHADLLLVTGPVTRNMAVPLRKTYEATPDPKLVVAVGDCARTCGVFAGATPSRAASTRSSRWTRSSQAARPSRRTSSEASWWPSTACRPLHSGDRRVARAIALPRHGARPRRRSRRGAGRSGRPERSGSGDGRRARGRQRRARAGDGGAPSWHTLPPRGAAAARDGRWRELPAGPFGRILPGRRRDGGRSRGALRGTYSRVYDGTPALRPLGALLNLFLLAMSLVPLADNVVTFVLAWELMSVASYLLVLTESDRRETREAGLWYLAMTHGGLVLLMAAFLILAGGAASTGFADLRAAAGALPPPARNAVFVLGLLGFGSKAGLVPLHVWLPRAHPAAPSHVSALMSGVMIKLGIYGLLRLALDLLGGGPPWWGGVVLAAGAVSALLGVLYALDRARPEAAAGLLVRREHRHHRPRRRGRVAVPELRPRRRWRSLALVAGLYHTLNHACFKGAAVPGRGRGAARDAHTRDMEQLGRADQAHAVDGAATSSSASPPSRRCRRSTASSPSGCCSSRSCPASAVPAPAVAVW